MLPQLIGSPFPYSSHRLVLVAGETRIHGYSNLNGVLSRLLGAVETIEQSGGHVMTTGSREALSLFAAGVVLPVVLATSPSSFAGIVGLQEDA